MIIENIYYERAVYEFVDNINKFGLALYIKNKQKTEFRQQRVECRIVFLFPFLVEFNYKTRF